MGVPALRELFKTTAPPVGEVKSLAELSTSYFQKHGRPLRIAVDEAGWRFKNLTDQQVAFVRTSMSSLSAMSKQVLMKHRGTSCQSDRKSHHVAPSAPYEAQYPADFRT